MALYSDPKKQLIGMTTDQLEAEASGVPGSVSTPQIARPGGFARGLYDVAATAGDYQKAIPKGIADGVNRTLVGVRNIAREGVGMAPLQPYQFNYHATRDDLAAQRAANTQPNAAQAPENTGASNAIAKPSFANVTGTVGPTVPATQSAARPQTGAGAPSAVGGAAPPKPGDVNTFTGRNGTRAIGTIAAPSTSLGSVTTQNFGTAAVPQAPGSIARPGVAPTFGISVTDPRIDDQRAIARPTLGPNQLAVSGTFRGPDAMAEQYNSREDREARNKQLGDIDTALFQLRGKNDPDSLRALTALTQTRAGLVGGGESLSADAVQGRANRDNAYGIADLNNAGENNRAGIQADVARAGQQVTREGQQLDYGAKLADIARPQLKQDANGNYINIAGNASTTVTDAQGNPVRGAQTEQAQQRDYGQENDNKMFTDLLATKIDQNGNPLPNAVDLAMADMQKYKAAQNQQTAQSASTAPTLDAYVKAARAAGYKQSDAELAAAFQKKYPQAK